jgi:TolB-like protein/DNA-binding winged helix-turn-helix (wHTH) protein/Tfp pilus assembly protein PilF
LGQFVDHSVQSPSVYRFGVFEADLGRRELLKHGIRIRLQEKPFLVLGELLRRPGEVVTREELRQRLWDPGTFVDFDEGVNTAVKRLRGCLGDSAEKPLYIETVSRYGYRFIAPVTAAPPKDEVTPREQTILDRVSLERQATGVESQAKKMLSRRRHWVWVLSACGALLLAVLSYRAWHGPATVLPVDIHSVAVLPMQNLSGDSSQEFFADGITDEITTVLAKLAGPTVISRTSAMQFKNTRKSVPEIARELNVGAIIEGSVERSGDRVRVRVQLIEASTDRHLWAEEYDRQLNDVFQLEAELAQDISRQVQLQLTERQRQEFARSRTVNPRAFEDYLQGRQYWALRTKDSLNKAVEYFHRAIEQDPRDARSYAGLAHCYVVMPMLMGLPQSEGLEKVRENATRALALDDSLPEAHLANAEALLYRDWEFAGAEKEFVHTLQLNPNYSTAHQWYAEYLGLMGRHDQAIEEARRATALDPLSAIAHHQAANILRNAGHYEEAIAEYNASLNISPSFQMSNVEMARVFELERKFPEAIQLLRTAIARHNGELDYPPGTVQVVEELPTAYAAEGMKGYYRQAEKIARYLARPHYYLGRDHAMLGERDAAITELTRSYQDRELEILWIVTDPDLDSLRPDPRFQQLIRAVGFPNNGPA